MQIVAWIQADKYGIQKTDKVLLRFFLFSIAFSSIPIIFTDLQRSKGYLNLVTPIISPFFYPPSSKISSCVRTADMVIRALLGIWQQCTQMRTGL